MTANTTFDGRFVDLQNANLTLPPYLTIPLQKVTGDLRNRKDFEKHYSPKLVSIGPIHHGRPNLELGEKYKLRWAAKFIQNTRRNPKDLYKKIADNIDELKNLFSDDVLTGVSCEGFDNLEQKLSWMLFVDGCSLLHILEIETTEQEENIKFDKLFLVFGDVLLIENQLPYQLLMMFLPVEESTRRNDFFFSSYNNEFDLIQKMFSFLLQYFCFLKVDNFYPQHRPIHLLDLLRQMWMPKSTRKFQVSKHNFLFEGKRYQNIIIKRKLVMNYLVFIYFSSTD